MSGLQRRPLFVCFCCSLGSWSLGGHCLGIYAKVLSDGFLGSLRGEVEVYGRPRGMAPLLLAGWLPDFLTLSTGQLLYSQQSVALVLPQAAPVSAAGGHAAPDCKSGMLLS